MFTITTFYKNYVRLCAQKGVSLSAAAEHNGLSRTTPNGWKKGKYPSDVTLEKLATYFEVAVSELTEDADNEKKPVLDVEDELDETTKELVKIAYEINEADRQMLLEMARSIRKRREG